MLLLERTVDIGIVPAAFDQAIRAALETLPRGQATRKLQQGCRIFLL